jgi:hypothetical protein
MRRYKMLRFGTWILASALALFLAAGPISAQQVGPADQKKNEEEAMAVVKRMADFLSQAQRFSVTADIGFDAVQDSGQKIEFGETRKILLDRPDRLRIEETKRNGSKSELVFNGKTIMIYYAKDNVYATTDRPGTLDDAVSYFVNDLGMRLPLSQLIDSKLAAKLPGQVLSAAYVEQSSIAGVPCDQIALRGEDADMQLWIAQGDQPLPQRVVITYKRLDGRPQFWAQFSDWNLKPKVSDKLFSVTPPKGAVKIAFAAQQMIPPGQSGTK